MPIRSVTAAALASALVPVLALLPSHLEPDRDPGWKPVDTVIAKIDWARPMSVTETQAACSQAESAACYLRDFYYSGCPHNLGWGRHHDPMLAYDLLICGANRARLLLQKMLPPPVPEGRR